MPLDLSLLDGGEFRDWIVGQRWFGSKSRDVAHIEIAECVPLREESRGRRTEGRAVLAVHVP